MHIATPRERDRTIDVARGIAILAIVLGHVNRGLAAGGIIDSGSEPFRWSDTFLYVWHLAVFALISGLFVARSRDRIGLGPFVRSRLVEWGWLYLMWTGVQGSVKLATGALVNQPTSVREVLSIWAPQGQLWFFPWLMIATVLAAIVRPWSSTLRTVSALIGSGIVALIAWGFEGHGVPWHGLALYVFYIAGTVLGAGRVSRLLLAIPPRTAGVTGTLGLALVGGVVLFTEVTAPTFGYESRTTASVSLGVIASVSAVLAVFVLARVLAPLPWARWLAFVGERSLVIFLAHIVAGSGTRILLSQIGIDAPAAHIAAGLIAGVGGSIAMWWLLERAHFPWLFSAPAQLTGRARSTPAR